VRKLVLFSAVMFALSVVLTGCGEPTQKAAQDSQDEIKKEMKASGDDKNAY